MNTARHNTVPRRMQAATVATLATAMLSSCSSSSSEPFVSTPPQRPNSGEVCSATVINYSKLHSLTIGPLALRAAGAVAGFSVDWGDTVDGQADITRVQGNDSYHTAAHIFRAPVGANPVTYQLAVTAEVSSGGKLRLEPCQPVTYRVDNDGTGHLAG